MSCGVLLALLDPACELVEWSDNRLLGIEDLGGVGVVGVLGSDGDCLCVLEMPHFCELFSVDAPEKCPGETVIAS